MAFCTNCGAQLEEGATTCPACGKETGAPAAAQPAQNAANDFVASVQNLNNTADTTAEYSQTDIVSGKGMSVLAYLGILCLIPLFAAKANRFVQFHVRQGFTLMLAEAALYTVNYISSLIFAKRWYGMVVGYSWPYYIIAIGCYAGLIAATVLAVIGIVNACRGRAKELPLTGKIKILK